MAFDLATIQQVTGTLFWQTVGVVAVVFLIMFIILVVGVLGIFAWIKTTYKTKVHYYPVYGNVVVKRNEDGTQTIDASNCTIGKEKVTSGKHFKKRSSLYFKVLRPYKTLPQIPQDMITESGVYFLYANNNFIPIYKPIANFRQEKEHGEKSINETIIKLYDLDKWIARRKLMIQELEQRYPERDVQIRIFALFIVGMICLTIIFGVMMYLSYKMQMKAIQKTDDLVGAIKAWGAKTGIVAPN